MGAFILGFIGAMGPEVSRVRLAGRDARVGFVDSLPFFVLHCIISGVLAWAIARDAAPIGQIYVGVTAPYIWSTIELRGLQALTKASNGAIDASKASGDHRRGEVNETWMTRAYIAAGLIMPSRLR